MKLSDYLRERGSVAELARSIGVAQAQVRQWQHGYADRRPSPANCVAIERATKRAVTRKDLRPDDWHEIWPELDRKQAA